MSGPANVLAWLDAKVEREWEIERATGLTNDAREPAMSVRAAVVDLIETNQRVEHHLAKAVEFIEKQYPDARQLDRGPIMRNMRRWRDQLSAALENVGGAK